VKDYFSFTRKERIAVFLLLGILTFIFCWPSIYQWAAPQQSFHIDTAWSIKMKKMEALTDTATGPDNPAAAGKQEAYQYDLTVTHEASILFFFDPNKISKQQWQQLGISEKTTTTIQNYLSKGGSFKKPEDLKKIYGMKQIDYERLFPYIQIVSPKVDKQADAYAPPDKHNNTAGNSFSSTGIIDINTADTTAFIKLPGIGSKLAARIVTFRDKLGGFYSVDQIKETYGLPDTVFQKIKSNLDAGNQPIRKININTASFDELRAHPYIKSDIGRQILAYRKEHGNYAKAEDLKKNPLITEDVYQRLRHYIATE
jgi:competence protein ComEA